MQKCHGWVTEDTVSQFAKGLNIGTDDAEEWTRPAKLVIVQAGDDSEIRLTIQEGKLSSGEAYVSGSWHGSNLY